MPDIILYIIYPFTDYGSLLVWQGVLFVDEAYRLSGRGERDFGPEAIEVRVGALDRLDSSYPLCYHMNSEVAGPGSSAHRHG